MPTTSTLRPVGAFGTRPAQIKRIPPGKKTINFKTPGQLEHILERARFSLGNIDRFLFLVNAGLHAIVANPVTRASTHGIIHHDHRQAADGDPLSLELVKLGNALFQRAPRRAGHPAGFF